MPRFYNFALLPIVTGLRNTLAILRKAQSHAESTSTPTSEYATAKLYPDMGDLCFQVYRLTDVAKAIPARLNASLPTLSMPDTETTLEEAIERVEKTLAFIESIDPASLDGYEDNAIAMPILDGAAHVVHDDAVTYLSVNGHPNFWFHVTVLYSLLRMKGVPVGKMDFLNGTQTLEFKLPDGEVTTDFRKVFKKE